MADEPDDSGWAAQRPAPAGSDPAGPGSTNGPPGRRPPGVGETADFGPDLIGEAGRAAAMAAVAAAESAAAAAAARASAAIAEAARAAAEAEAAAKAADVLATPPVEAGWTGTPVGPVRDGGERGLPPSTRAPDAAGRLDGPAAGFGLPPEALGGGPVSPLRDPLGAEPLDGLGTERRLSGADALFGALPAEGDATGSPEALVGGREPAPGTDPLRGFPPDRARRSDAPEHDGRSGGAPDAGREAVLGGELFGAVGASPERNGRPSVRRTRAQEAADTLAEMLGAAGPRPLGEDVAGTGPVSGGPLAVRHPVDEAGRADPLRSRTNGHRPPEERATGHRPLEERRPTGYRSAEERSNHRPPEERTSGHRPPEERPTGERSPEERLNGHRPPGERPTGSRPPEERSNHRSPEERSSGYWPLEERPNGHRSPEERTSGPRPPEERTNHRPLEERTSGHRPPEERTNGRRLPEERTNSHRPPEERPTGHRRPAEPTTDHRLPEERRTDPTRPAPSDRSAAWPDPGRDPRADPVTQELSRIDPADPLGTAPATAAITQPFSPVRPAEPATASADAPPQAPARSPQPPPLAAPPRHRAAEPVGETTESMAPVPPEADDPSVVTAVILPAPSRRSPRAVPAGPASLPLRVVPSGGSDDTTARPTGPARGPGPVPGPEQPVRPPAATAPAPAPAPAEPAGRPLRSPAAAAEPAGRPLRSPAPAAGPPPRSPALAGPPPRTPRPVPERAPDPDRGRVAVEPAPSIGRAAETGGDAGAAGAEEAAVSVPAQRGNQAEQESEPTPSGRKRRSLRGVLAVAAAVVLLGLAGLVSTLESAPEPEPVAAAPAAAPTTRPSTTPATAGAVLDAPLRAAVDPQSRPAAAYLDALRQAEVPTSRTGLAETEAAEVICRQLANGTDQATMVRAVPAVLSTVTPAQAPIVVRAAQDHYCGS